MSIDALNCGNTFSAAATTFTTIAVTVRLPPAASACFAYFFRSSSSAGDVGEIVLRDVRNRRPRGAQVLGRLSAHRAHRLALDLAPAREVGQRDGGAAAAAADCRRSQQSASRAPSRRRPRCGRSARCPGPRRCRRRARAPCAGPTAPPGPAASPAPSRLGRRHARRGDVDDLLGSLCGAGHGRAACAAFASRLCRWSSSTTPGLSTGVAAPAFDVLFQRAFLSESLPARFSRGRFGAVLGFAARRRPRHVRIAWPTLTLSPALTLIVLHLAGDRRGHFDGRLVGFELEDRLVLRERVARLDQHAQHVARRDVLAEFGKCEVSHDELRSSPIACTPSGRVPGSALRIAGLLFSGLMLCALIACCDHRRVDLAVARQRRQRGDDDVAIVDLEEVAQARAVLAAAEPVGAERGERPRQPAIDRVGQSPSRSRTPRRTRPARPSGTASTYGTRGVSPGCSMFQRSHACPSRYSSP